jgi:hypothetical protein
MDELAADTSFITDAVVTLGTVKYFLDNGQLRARKDTDEE